MSIGSNLGDRVANCELSLKMLDSAGSITVVKRSRLYETAPWGVTEQPGFINACAELETSLQPDELLRLVKGIEAAIGRVGSFRWGPRSIDLDIVLYGDVVIDSENLIIPHPYMHERLFVLEPLCEIASQVMHPVLKKSARELLDALVNR